MQYNIIIHYISNWKKLKYLNNKYIIYYDIRVSENNKINELMESTKCWICLNPLFVPAVISVKWSILQWQIFPLVCLVVKGTKTKYKEEWRGNLRLPCGCSINLTTPEGMKYLYV